MAHTLADYPFRVNKVTISGDCWAGTEEWSTGFFLGNPAGDAIDPGSTTASAIAPLWSAFFTALPVAVSTAYRTLEVKVSQLTIDGNVDINMIDYHTYPAPIAGAASGNPHPPQITLAATLTSDVQRGLAAKGRMYLPGITKAISTATPKISATNVGDVATALKTFFDGVKGLVGVDDPMLVSKGHKVVPVPPSDPNDYHYIGGKIAPVTGFRIGDVYDTQRRRRGEIPEAYVSRVLA